MRANGPFTWPIYVVTSAASDRADVECVTFGPLDNLPSWLEANTPETQRDSIICCDGGGKLISALSDQIDEWTLRVVPTLLGQGIPLFRDGRPSERLQAEGAASYNSGLIQLRYTLAP